VDCVRAGRGSTHILETSIRRDSNGVRGCSDAAWIMASVPADTSTQVCGVPLAEPASRADVRNESGMRC
jgi:hypothetical protein